MFSIRITDAAEHQASKPSRVTVCHSPRQVCISHSASLPVFFFYFFSHTFAPSQSFSFLFWSSSFSFTLAPLCLGSLGPHKFTSPPATKVEFHSFIFLFSYFFFPGYQHPSLAPSLLCLDTCSHLSFYLLADLGYCYIKPPLSQVHVELTQKYNVTTLERNTDGELCN